MNGIAAWMLAASLCAAQVPVVDSPAFPKELQTTVLTATVRINNVAQKTEGSGVLVGRSGPFVYILTAQHVVDGADRLEIAVFSKKTYPLPKATYRSAEVLAQARDLTDLAVLRLATSDVMPAFIRPCPEGGVPSASELLVLSAGCDLGRLPTCLPEKLAKKQRARRKGSQSALFWELERADPSGRSGGPLVDVGGRLVGMCSGCNRGKTYFTHIEEIQAFLKRNGLRWLLDKENR